MSELKTISGKEIREELDYNTIGVDPDDKEFNGLELAETQYYIKSEADKVIAKLKADYSAEVEELCIEKTNVDTLEQAWKQSQRALWLMRAYFCGRSSEYFSGMASRCKIGQEDFYKEVSERAQRYLRACYKCQAMVKRYGEDK